MEIVLVNRSSILQDEELRQIARAVLVQLTQSFCPAWDLLPPLVRFVPAGAPISKDAYLVAVVDKGDVTGALGYHDQVSGSVVDAFIFCEPSLMGGGTKIKDCAPGAVTIASVVSHEILEMIIDPTINAWWDGPLSVNGRVYASVAAEVGDPVQPHTTDDFHVVHLDGETFWLANFILPAWRDSHAASGPFDALGKLQAPFTMTPGGYLIVRNAPGLETNEFGARVTAAAIARSKGEFARRSRVKVQAYRQRPRW